MITEKMKDALANENGLVQERFVELVRSGVKNKLKLTPDDEIAILRKAVAIIFDVVALLHPETISNEEFKAYHETVESLKIETLESIESRGVKNGV